MASMRLEGSKKTTDLGPQSTRFGPAKLDAQLRLRLGPADRNRRSLTSRPRTGESSDDFAGSPLLRRC